MDSGSTLSYARLAGDSSAEENKRKPHPEASTAFENASSDHGGNRVVVPNEIRLAETRPSLRLMLHLKPLPRYLRNSMGHLADVPILQRNKGLLLIALSQLFFVIMHTFVKSFSKLDPPISTLELVGIRMALTYFCCIAYMYWQGVQDPLLGPKGFRLFLIFRGLAGFFRVYGVYFSLQYLSLSDATVLTFLSPLCTAVTQPQVIFGQASHENANSRIAGATPRQRMIAVGAGLVGVIGATGVYTIVRFIGERAHPLHTLMYFSSACVVSSFVGMLVTQEAFYFPLDFTWIGLLLLITISGICAQVFLTMGLQREAAGRGTLAIYVQIIFASALEQLYFPSAPSVFSVVGTIIILGSAIFVAVTKRTEKKRRVLSEEEGMQEAGTQPMEVDGAAELEDLDLDRIRLLQEDASGSLNDPDQVERDVVQQN